jgi:hypothetical protein
MIDDKKFKSRFRLFMWVNIILSICLASLVIWVVFTCVSEVSERGLKDIFQDIWLGEDHDGH